MAKFREKLEVSSEIPGKFGTFGIITVSIRSIAATSPGFPTGAPTFWTGVPFCSVQNYFCESSGEVSMCILTAQARTKRVCRDWGPTLCL